MGGKGLFWIVALAQIYFGQCDLSRETVEYHWFMIMIHVQTTSRLSKLQHQMQAVSSRSL